MNILSSILVSFCAACIFIGALYMLCPDGTMSKTVKYILGLVFLVSVISAAGITVKMPDIDFSPPDTVNQSARLDTASAKYVYSYILENAGIDFSEITVCTDKSADGSIIISKVIIRSDCERERILSVLGEAGKNHEVEIINE